MDRVMTGLPMQSQTTEARLSGRRDQMHEYLADPRNPVYIKNVTPSVVNIEDRWNDKGLKVTLRGFQAANLSDTDRNELASSEGFKKALHYGQIVFISEDQYLQELDNYRAAMQQQALIHQQRMQTGLIDVGGRQVNAQILDTSGGAAPAAPDPRQMLKDPIAYAQAVNAALAQGVSPEQFAQMVENQRVPIGLQAQFGQPQIMSGGAMPGMQRQSAGPKPISAVGEVASVPGGAYDPIRMTRTGGATVAAPIGQGENAIPNYPTVPMGNFNMQGSIPGYGGYAAPPPAAAQPQMQQFQQPQQFQPQQFQPPQMYPQQTHADQGFQQQVPQPPAQPAQPLIYNSLPQPPPQQLVYPGQQVPQQMPQGPLAPGQAEVFIAQQAASEMGRMFEVGANSGDDVAATMAAAGIRAE